MKLWEGKNEWFVWWAGLVGLTLIYWLKITASPNLQTTFDSEQYIALAQKLMYGSSWWQSGQINAYGQVFVPYAPAYPVCISVVSFITGLSAIWASKWVGYACLIGLFRVVGSSNPGMLLPCWILLVSDATMHIFTHTWAEGLMITGFVLCVLRYNQHFAITLLAGVTAICCRSAAAVGGLGLLTSSVFTRTGSRNLNIIIIIGLGLLIQYIGYEGTHSSLFTGGVREAAITGWSLIDLLRVVGQSLAVFKMTDGANSIAVHFCQGLVFFSFLRYVSKSDYQNNHHISLTLLTGGLFYLALSMVTTQFYVLAEGLDVRLFYPGALLATIGIFHTRKFTALKTTHNLVIMAAITLLHLPWRWLLG